MKPNDCEIGKKKPTKYELIEVINLLGVPDEDFKQRLQNVEANLRTDLSSKFSPHELLQYIISAANSAISNIKLLNEFDKNPSSSNSFSNSTAQLEDALSTSSSKTPSVVSSPARDQRTPFNSSRADQVLKQLDYRLKHPVDINEPRQLRNTSASSSQQTTSKKHETNPVEKNIECTEVIDVDDDDEEVPKRITRSANNSTPNHNVKNSPIKKSAIDRDQQEQSTPARVPRAAAIKAKVINQRTVQNFYSRTSKTVPIPSPPKPSQSSELMKRRRLVSSSSEFDDNEDENDQSTSTRSNTGQPPSKFTKEAETPPKKRPKRKQIDDESEYEQSDEESDEESESDYEEESEQDASDEEYDPDQEEKQTPKPRRQTTTNASSSKALNTVAANDDSDIEIIEEKTVVVSTPPVRPVCGLNKITTTLDNDKTEIMHIYGKFDNKNKTCSNCDRTSCSVNKSQVCKSCHDLSRKYADENFQPNKKRYIELYKEFLGIPLPQA